MTIKENAKKWFELLGVPVIATRKKIPFSSWKIYETKPMTKGGFEDQEWSVADGYSLVLGRTQSGKFLSLLDFDNHDKENWKDADFTVFDTFLEKTPHGFHALLLSDKEPPTINDYTELELISSKHLCNMYDSPFNTEQIKVVEDVIPYFQDCVNRFNLKRKDGIIPTQIPFSLEKLLSTPVSKGDRNRWIIYIGSKLRGQNKTKEEVEATLTEWNTKYVTPPLSAQELHSKVLDIFRPEKPYYYRKEDEQLLPDGLTPLERLRKVFHKWFKYKDETLLDLCLAVKIHSLKLDQFRTSLWLFIIGNSGDRKSSTVMSFYEDYLEENDRRTYFLNHLTKNTLATGFKKCVCNDLAPKLKDKLVLTGDMAQFIKLHEMEKNCVWSQLREAYEGRVQRDTGSGVNTFYTDNFFDWLACSTPVIDEELILKNMLGTRELLYRMPDENGEGEERIAMMDQVWKNVNHKEEQRTELNQAIRQFFTSWLTSSFEVEISEQVKNKLFEYAIFITQLRVTAECDWKTGELTNFVYPEKPTRILEQLKMLYLCLRRISPDYTDEIALDRVFKVVKSSIHPVRLSILLALLERGELSTTQIAKQIGLHYATTNRELQVCKQLDILLKTETVIENRETYIWQLNKFHPIHKVLVMFKDGVKNEY